MFTYGCSTDCDAGLNIVICIALDISTTKNDFNLLDQVGTKCMPYCHTFNVKIMPHVCKGVEATLYVSLYSLCVYKHLVIAISRYRFWAEKSVGPWQISKVFNCMFPNLETFVKKHENFGGGWLLLEKCLQLEILHYYNYHEVWPNISMDTFSKPLIVYTKHCVAYVVPKLDTDSMCVSNCKQLRRCLSAPTPPSLWHYMCSVKWKRGCRQELPNEMGVHGRNVTLCPVFLGSVLILMI